MAMTFGVWVAVAIGTVAVALVLRRVLSRPSTDLDAGGVSQNWLNEHNSNKNDLH